MEFLPVPAGFPTSLSGPVAPQLIVLGAIALFLILMLTRAIRQRSAVVRGDARLPLAAGPVGARAGRLHPLALQELRARGL